MTPAPDPEDWLDEVERRRLTAEECAGLRQDLCGRPRELARLDQELALNKLLDGRAGHRASGNFTRRVMDAIALDEAATERARAGRRRWLWLPRFALTAALLLAVGAGWWQFRSSRRSQIAAGVVAVSRAAAIPGVEVLQDFEAIRSFRTAAQPGDVALLAALNE